MDRAAAQRDRLIARAMRGGSIDAGGRPSHAAAVRFFSDNAAAAHPAVIDAIGAANRLDAPYDGDCWSARLDQAFSALFETEVTALWVSTGTAANALALAALCPPHGAIVCHREAHIQLDECGAPEFYSHGAKLLLAEGNGAKLDPAAVAAVCDGVRRDVHQSQPHALSITNASEYGLVYSRAEIAALGELCAARGLGFHVDGARFANAVAASDASPAELTWRGGVDALSFGFVKNGGLSAEALILFRPELAETVRYRRKRGGHLLSKGRYLAAQLLALLEDDLWLANARAANAAAALLAAAAGDRLLHPAQANELFLRLDPREAAALRSAGFEFYDWGPGAGRLVTSWDQSAEAVEALAAALRGL